MSNYYRGQIKEYVSNYEDAIKKLDSVYASLEELYSSFSAATGADITKIRSDINVIKANITNAKHTITTAMNNTIARAESSDRCYNKYLNKEYAAYETGDRSYGTGANVYIDDGGMIHVVREYIRKQGLIESIFMSHAGEYYDEEVISISEMFNS